MQQFVVPQFIEVEDKILGPVTTRQFLILLVTGIIIFLFYRFADLALFITAFIVIGGFSVILAFVKVNGQTFHYFMLNIFLTLKQPGLRVWNKTHTNEELNYFRAQGIVEIAEAAAPRKAAHRDRIRDLALVVNTGGFYRPEGE